MEISITRAEIYNEVLPRILPEGGEEEATKDGLFVTKWEWFTVAYYVSCNMGGSDVKLHITNTLVEVLGIDTDELQKRAIEHLNSMVTVCDLEEVMNRLFGMPVTEHDPDYTPNMLVVSVESNQYGAAALMSQKAMSEIKAVFGERFCILPSSVHEIIAIPWMGDMESLSGMVQKVNDTQVEPQEQLYDRAFFYADGCIQQAS